MAWLFFFYASKAFHRSCWVGSVYLWHCQELVSAEGGWKNESYDSRWFGVHSIKRLVATVCDLILNITRVIFVVAPSFVTPKLRLVSSKLETFSMAPRQIALKSRRNRTRCFNLPLEHYINLTRTATPQFSNGKQENNRTARATSTKHIKWIIWLVESGKIVVPHTFLWNCVPCIVKRQREIV